MPQSYYWIEAIPFAQRLFGWGCHGVFFVDRMRYRYSFVTMNHFDQFFFYPCRCAPDFFEVCSKEHPGNTALYFLVHFVDFKVITQNKLLIYIFAGSSGVWGDWIHHSLRCSD
ncbi:hypothetical protein [Flavobacterium sp.]|uniref:hypothetical protein n=1 Tax=Flavobacterium sp. TaxID=239 RepID=UPI0026271312|nr:hypothetical protein [Flavobacterium sp.]